MTEEFEMSLQVLRGFDTDISAEVNDIKVTLYVAVCAEMHPFFDPNPTGIIKKSNMSAFY